MRRRKKMLAVMLISLLFLRGNAPMPGPYFFSSDDFELSPDGTQIKNNSAEPLLYFDPSPYQDCSGMLIAPSQQVEAPKNFVRGSRLYIYDEECIYIGESIDVSYDEDGTFRFEFQNPEEGKYLFSLGLAYVDEQGVTRFALIHEYVDPGKKEAVTAKLPLPANQEYMPVALFNNDYYNSRYPGDPHGPLAIAVYVVGGFLAASLVAGTVVLIIKRKRR